MPMLEIMKVAVNLISLKEIQLAFVESQLIISEYISVLDLQRGKSTDKWSNEPKMGAGYWHCQKSVLH